MDKRSKIDEFLEKELFFIVRKPKDATEEEWCLLNRGGGIEKTYTSYEQAMRRASDMAYTYPRIEYMVLKPVARITQGLSVEKM